MPIYNRGDVARFRTSVEARISCGYILPRADINSAQIGTGGATWLWWNLRSQLARLILYRQIANRQPHIILQWKNVWMYTNLLWKMWWCNRIFIWKMWMMLTLILIWITICAWKYSNAFIYRHKAAYCW